MEKEKKNSQEGVSLPKTPFSFVPPEAIDEAIKGSPAFQGLSEAFGRLADRLVGLEGQVNQVIPVLQKIDAAISQATKTQTQTKEGEQNPEGEGQTLAQTAPPWLQGLGYLLEFTRRAEAQSKDTKGADQVATILDSYFKGREHEKDSMKATVAFMRELSRFLMGSGKKGSPHLEEE